jgi:hypothetical protein
VEGETPAEPARALGRPGTHCPEVPTKSGSLALPRERLQPLDIELLDVNWVIGRDEARQILHAAAIQLWRHVPDRALAPIVVGPQGGPLVYFERGARGEYHVRLDSVKTPWMQYPFQFAHELCHILCGHDRHQKHFTHWFEECVCETAGLYAIRRLAEEWADRPPRPDWKARAPVFRKFADDRMRAAALPPGTRFPAWFRDNEKALARCPDVERVKIVTVCCQLLTLFEQDPARWEAVTWINEERTKPSCRLSKYLAAWRRHVPNRHKDFIADVARLFEVELPAEPAPVLLSR